MTSSDTYSTCMYKYIKHFKIKKTAHKPSKIKALSGFSFIYAIPRKKARDGTRTREIIAITVEITGFLKIP